MTAERSISWLESLNEARKVSAESGRPMLMFFHHKQCTGCKNTISKTLPKMSVIDMVTDNYVPVVLDVEEEKSHVETYSVEWTPTFIVADETGKEVIRWVGYLPEDDFLAQLDISLARNSFRKGDYKNAERLFDQVAIKYPLTDLAPEACYYQGVCRYRSTNDPSYLEKTFDNLKEAYPESIWTTKASAWSKEQIKKAA